MGGYISALDYDENQDILATGDSFGIVSIWRLKEFKCLNVF